MKSDTKPSENFNKELSAISRLSQDTLDNTVDPKERMVLATLFHMRDKGVELTLGNLASRLQKDRKSTQATAEKIFAQHLASFDMIPAIGDTAITHESLPPSLAVVADKKDLGSTSQTNVGGASAHAKLGFHRIIPISALGNLPPSGTEENLSPREKQLLATCRKLCRERGEVTPQMVAEDMGIKLGNYYNLKHVLEISLGLRGANAETTQTRPIIADAPSPIAVQIKPEPALPEPVATISSTAKVSSPATPKTHDWTLLIRRIEPEALEKVHLTPLERRFVEACRTEGYAGMTGQQMGDALGTTPGTISVAKSYLKTKLGALITSVEPKAASKPVTIEETPPSLPKPVIDEHAISLPHDIVKVAAAHVAAPHAQPASDAGPGPAYFIRKVKLEGAPTITEMINFEDAARKLRAIKDDDSIAVSGRIENQPPLIENIPPPATISHRIAPRNPAPHREKAGTNIFVKTSPIIPVEYETLSSSKSIPEELRPLWIKLTKVGTPVMALATFEGYLAGDTPMTDAQMEAGCKAMNCFASSANKNYHRLANFVMNSLHDRFAAADDEEKTKISWIVNSLFSASYNHFYENQFQNMMNGIGDNYATALHTVIEKGVHDALKKPKSGNSLALMHRIVQKDLLDLRREILGRSNRKADAPSTQGRRDRNNIVYASSIHSIVNPDGKTIEDTLPSETGGPLDILLMLEHEHNQKEVIRILRELPTPTLNSREQAFLTHFFAMAENGEDPTLDDIAVKMGLSESRVCQIKNATVEKLRAYFSEKIGEQKAVLQLASEQTEGSHDHAHVALNEESPKKNGAATERSFSMHNGDHVANALPAKTHAGNADARKRKTYTQLKDLGDIPVAALKRAHLTRAEQELIAACTSMPEEDITTESVAQRMNLTPHYVNVVKRNIERKISPNQEQQFAQK